MGRRPRRNSALYSRKKKVISQENVNSESYHSQNEASSSQASSSQASTSQETVKKSYMKSREEDIFIQKCVESFDEINDLSTIRVIPESMNARQHRDKVRLAWENITKEMNELCNVCIIESVVFLSDINYLIWIKFLIFF